MAGYYKPGVKEMREWDEWVAGRPAPVRAIAEQVKPWILYRLRSCGKRGILRGICQQEEAYMVVLHILPKFNPMLAGTQMQATVPVEDLEPCDLPGPGDRVGMFYIPQRADGWVTEH